MDKRIYDLREIAAQEKALCGQTVTVQGWIRNHRKQKNIGFIEFIDGTVLAPMQIVYDEHVEDFAGVQTIRNGAAIRATGVLVAGRGGALEMQAKSVALEGDIKRNLNQDGLRAQLAAIQDKAQDTGRFKLWKGRVKKHEESADK